MLTFAVADDVASIVVIAVVYSDRIDLAALGAGLAFLGLVVAARRLGVRHGPVYLLLGVAAWIAFFESGVDPVVVGLVMGLLALAYPATRRDLERAFESFRLFREQPVPELARAAQQSVRTGSSSCSIPGAATWSCRCSPWRTRASPSTEACWPALTRRRSRSGSCSATSGASRPAPSRRPGCWPG
jgi:hypothetical protein